MALRARMGRRVKSRDDAGEKIVFKGHARAGANALLGRSEGEPREGDRKDEGSGGSRRTDRVPPGAFYFRVLLPDRGPQILPARGGNPGAEHGSAGGDRARDGGRDRGLAF